MPRTNQEQVDFHLERMQHWQSVVDDFNEEALLKARIQIAALKPREDGLEPDPYYVAKVLLEDSFAYKRAVSQRNGFQAGLETYTLLVQLEKLGEQAERLSEPHR